MKGTKLEQQEVVVEPKAKKNVVEIKHRNTPNKHVFVQGDANAEFEVIDDANQNVVGNGKTNNRGDAIAICSYISKTLKAVALSLICVVNIFAQQTTQVNVQQQTVTVTNNAAPFSFNNSTKVLNVPKQDRLENNGNNTMKFTRGDGTTFDSVQVYLIPEPFFTPIYKLANETLLNSTQTIGYTQGGISKTLLTKANCIIIDNLAASIQNINIPNPSLAVNARFEFSISWLKVPNQITFNYPIYDRIEGVLYSSQTFVPDNRDFMTLPKIYATDILFKSFAYHTYHIVNTNGKYFIQR